MQCRENTNFTYGRLYMHAQIHRAHSLTVMCITLAMYLIDTPYLEGGLALRKIR